MEQQLYSYYSKPQQGYGYYTGQRLPAQYGGSILSGIGRFIIPIARFIGKNLFDIGVNSGREFLYENKPIKEALYNSVLKQGTKLINKDSQNNNVDTFIHKQKSKRKK